MNASFLRRGAAVVLAAAAACSASLPTAAQVAAPGAAASAAVAPAELFSRPSEFRGATLSRDRKTMAFIARANNRAQAAVWDLATNKITRLTNFTKQNAISLRWVNNERLLISLDYDGNESFGLYAINKDGSQLRVLVEPPVIQGMQGALVAKYVAYEGPIEGSDREVLVAANDRAARVPDLYRMDVYSGRRTLLTTERPAEVRGWVLDNASVPRIALAWDKAAREYVTWYRDGDGVPWREVQRTKPGEKSTRVLSFASDNRSGWAISNVGRDTDAIFEIDVPSGKLGKMLFEAPDGFDMGTEPPQVEPPSSTNRGGGIVFGAGEPKRPIGFFFEGAKPTTVWIDEAMARHQRSIDAALPGRFNQLRPAKDGERMLVVSRSDRHPGTYYWFDPKAGTLEHIADAAPWIDERRMAAMQPIEYKARDGLRIRGYLTLPPGREPKNLPTIVHPHGGPWARDTWGFNPDVQFLAALGYAVLQMDYRISEGYGYNHFTAGFKTIGQAMQDDKTDGLRWLVAQGIADPKRVCIYGGSYGGYAAMWGLAKDPDLYRCGVNIVGVTDWNIILRGLWYAGRESFGPDEISRWIGSIDNAEDRARLEAVSPVEQASRIRAPVLMAYGRNDPRVPLDHLASQASALSRAGKAFEQVTYDNEGHGWRNPENRLDWYRRMEAFLRKHNPPN